MSTNSTSPANFIGGTWERIQGQFLLGASSSYSAGSTGGSADAIVVSHAHSMPSSGSHGHSLRYYSYNGSQGQNNVTLNFNGYGGSLSQDINNVSVIGSGTHTHTINSTGESGTGKNMPPYIAVYVWKRTA